MAGRHPADESKLIDDYLVALRNDPDAPPPPGMDAKTAAFLRQLARAESAPSRLEPGQHARIWHKALGLAATPAHQPRPGHNRFIRNRPGDSSMFASPQTRQRSGVHLSAPGVLLPFAVVLVILFVAVIVRFSPSGPNSGNRGVPPLGAGNEQAQRETATPTMTATPFPATLPAPVVTATPVIPFGLETPTPLSRIDVVAPSPFPPTVVPPGFTVTSTPILVPPVAVEQAIRMNSTTRDELTPERPLVTYRLPVEEDGWVAVAVRPDDPSLDLTLSYDLAQLEPEAGAPSGGGGGGAGGGYMPLDQIGLFTYARSGSILSLTIGANNISVLGRSYFTLSIYQQDPVAVRVAQLAQAALSPGQQAGMFVIESGANQLVDLNVESDGRADLYLNVLEIDGETEMAGHIYRGPIIGCMQGQPLFCMDQDGGVRRDPELTDVTLLEGRRYVIVVRALELNAETEFTLSVSPR